jgi:hypothetical protein
MGLYYPYIHFKDEQWLRIAALYWARMARIVPDDYPLRDSEDVRRLAGELGFVKNLAPSERVKGEVGKEFADLVRKKGEALVARYGVHLRDQWPPDPYSMQVAGPVGPEASLGWIHVDKVDFQLRNALIDSGLGLNNRGGDPMWVGVHPRLAAVYMSALAEGLGRANLLSPVTDESLSHLAVGGWPLPRLAQALLDQRLTDAAPGVDQLADALAVLAIGYVVPRNLSNIPVTKIVQLRREHAAELDAFRTHVANLAVDLGQLAKVEDPALLTEHLRVVYETKLAPAKRELERGLRSAGVDTAMGAMNVQLAAPALLTSTAALAGATVHPLVALGGALVVGAIPVLRKHRAARKGQTEETPVAYLMHVERGLAPNTLLNWCREHLYRFLGRD